MKRGKKNRKKSFLFLLAGLLILLETLMAYGESPGSYVCRWRVVYTDSTHQMTFAAAEEGSCPNGTEIYIGFPRTIYVGNEIWETSAVPGKRVINGPGLEIIYVKDTSDHTNVRDLTDPGN